MATDEPTDNLTDQTELINAASQGDVEAVDTLLTRHIPRLEAFVRFRAGHVIRAKESVSDVVQSVCREVLEHVDRYRHGGEVGFRQWLYETALRKINNRYRYWSADKRDAGREASPARQLTAADLTLAIENRSPHDSPSEHAIAHEQVERLRDAMLRLTDDEQEIITLSRIVGYSHAQIARELECSEEVARARLCRGLARLADMMVTDDD